MNIGSTMCITTKHKTSDTVLSNSSRIPNKNNMAQSNQSRIFCHMAHAHHKSSGKTFPWMWGKQKGHMWQQKQGVQSTKEQDKGTNMHTVHSHNAEPEIYAS